MKVFVSHFLGGRGPHLQLSPLGSEVEQFREEGERQSVATVVGGVGHED